MSRRRMPRIVVAVLIGAVMGLVYLVVNASTLPQPASAAVRVFGLVAFAGVLVAVRALPRSERDPSRGGFTAGYWVTVAAEVVLGLGGVVILTQVVHAPDATLPWITLVVGVHFFGLGLVWRAGTQHGVAAGLTACGAAGLVAVAVGASTATVGLISGVLPGLVLLGAAYGGVATARRRGLEPVGSHEQRERGGHDL